MKKFKVKFTAIGSNIISEGNMIIEAEGIHKAIDDVKTIMQNNHHGAEISIIGVEEYK